MRCARDVPMRILLRDRRSGLYYLAPNRWTEHRAFAYDFKAGYSAIEAGLRDADAEVEMVYAFRDSTDDFAVPIRRNADRSAAN